jgi:hypothetical protein
MKMENLKAQYQVIIDGFTMLGTLIGGRIGIPIGIGCSQIWIDNSNKYSDQRRQFGPEGLEVPILNYRIHQRRLLPLLAKHMQFILHYNTLRIVSLLKKNLKCRRLKPCCRYEGLFYLEHNSCFTGMS